MNWLGRIAEYERPWVGRVGLALIVVLWLFITVVGFAADVATGLGFLIVGGALIVGEVWIERSGARHTTFVLVWRLFWRIGVGFVVIWIGAVSSDGWTVAVAVLLGSWLILSGLDVARFRWVETQAPPAERSD